MSRPRDGRPRGHGKPGSGRGHGYNPGERIGRGTKHGGKGKSMGGGQTRPPQGGCRDKKTMMLALYLTLRAMALLAIGRHP